MTKRLLLLLLALTIAAVAVGCGDDEDSSGSDSKSGKDDGAMTDTETTATADGGGDAAGQTTLALKNVPGELKFDKTELTAKAGAVKIELTNDDQIPHNVAIDVDGKKTEGELVTKGDVSSITVDLKPGTYEYYCSPHEGAGMKGTLTVT